MKTTKQANLGTSALTVSKHAGRKLPWCVNVNPRVTGKRERHFFPSREAAEDWRDGFMGKWALVGTDGIGKMREGVLTVKHAIDRFTAKRELSGWHGQHAAYYLGLFSAQFGGLGVEAIGPDHLEAFWQRPSWGPTTRAQAFRYVRLFWNWAEKRDIVARNPARRCDPPRASRPPKGILTPGAMFALIWAQRPRVEAYSAMVGAYFTLGAFAGLRTSESLAFDPANWDGNALHVLTGKTGARYVTPLAPFRLLYNGYDLRTISRRTLHEACRAVCRMAGVSWPPNCLRHSFASYHLALYEDAPKTAFQLGHSSPAMVYRAYARAVRKEDARAWNALHLLDARARVGE